MNKIKALLRKYKLIVAFLGGALFTQLDGWQLSANLATDVAHAAESEFNIEVPFL